MLTILLSKLLIYATNDSGPNTDTLSTPLATGLQSASNQKNNTPQLPFDSFHKANFESNWWAYLGFHVI